MCFSRTSGIAVFLFLHIVGLHHVLGNTVSKTIEEQQEKDATEKNELDKNVTVAKCCPTGQIFHQNSLGGDPTCAKSDISWKIPINGTFYNSTILVYDNRSKIKEYQDVKGFCKKPGSKVQHKSGNSTGSHFTLGTDGLLHYTEAHHDIFHHNTNKTGSPEFCIELESKNDEDFSNPEDYENYEDDEKEVDNFERGEEEEDISGSGGDDEDEEPGIKIFYCTEEFTKIRKCCARGKNININGGSCTDHLAKKDGSGKGFINEVKPYFPIQLKNSHAEDPEKFILDDIKINRMKKEYLSVTSHEFELKKSADGLVVIYRDDEFQASDYCLDIVLDYCEGNNMKPTLRAVINNKLLKESKMTTVYGSGDDTHAIRTFKQTGYIISIFFLLLTLAIYCVIKEVRIDLGGKMVMFLAASMVCVYLCLLIRTFESQETKKEAKDQNDGDLKVSKTNSKCIALASFTYFFTMSNFGWMNAMSYNIVNQFRGQSRLPAHFHKRRLGFYSLYSFGVPALMTLTVGLLNQADLSSSSDTSNSTLENNPNMDQNFTIEVSDWRPGIGEESCWLSSCSNGQLLYFYLPIGIALVCNLAMFVFASRILNQLENKRNLLLKTKPARSVSHEPSARKFSRQLSTIQKSVSNKVKSQKANTEKYYMLLKLFIAMGLTWFLELIALAVSQFTDEGDVPQWTSVILNIANVLQGIVIFFVFGFKPSIRNHIKAKYQGRNLQSSQSKTGSTRTRKTSTLSNASNLSSQNSTTRPSLTKLVSFSPSSEGPDVVFTESSDK